MGEVLLQGHKQLVLIASKQAKKAAACFQNLDICSGYFLASCGVKAKGTPIWLGTPA